MVTIIHKRDSCVGCGACVGLAPDIFEMKEGKAMLIGKEVEQLAGSETYFVDYDDFDTIMDKLKDICPFKCIGVKTDE